MRGLRGRDSVLESGLQGMDSVLESGLQGMDSVLESVVCRALCTGVRGVNMDSVSASTVLAWTRSL